MDTGYFRINGEILKYLTPSDGRLLKFWNASKELTIGGYFKFIDGDEALFDENGNLHHIKIPSFITANGTKMWYVHGQLHRDDGPAIEYVTQSRSFENEWWYEGELISSRDQGYDLYEFQKSIKLRKIRIVLES